MLRTQRGSSAASPRTVSLIFFSVGGQLLAVRAEEVGGIWPWPVSLPVPSGTPHVNGVAHQGDAVMPVFDLAGRLGTQVQGIDPLCLIAKCEEGPMAVRIDQAVPSIQAIDPENLLFGDRVDQEVIGTCRVGHRAVPVYSFLRLTRASKLPEMDDRGL